MNKPTDAELNEFIESRMPAYWQYGGVEQDRLRALVCAVLDKRGQPAHSGEPPRDDWLQSGALLYRLTDGRRPCNRDEILVTMADGLRSMADLTRRAGELQALLQPQPVEREPLTPEAQVFELLRGVDSLDALAVWRAAEAAHGITQKGGQHESKQAS